MHWRAIQQLHRIIAVVIFVAMAAALANYCALQAIADSAAARERQTGALERIAVAAESFLAQEYGNR